MENVSLAFVSIYLSGIWTSLPEKGMERLNMKDYICFMKYILDCYRKQPGFFALSILLLSLILITSCNPKAGAVAEENTAIAADTLPGDFVTFYDRFHQDSAFQMDHIMFPLEGLPNSSGDNDTLTSDRFFWQKANWKLHKPFTDPGQHFTQWYEVPNDRVIEHWIQMNGTNLYMKRRFAKLEDGWYLIYYQGLRPTNRESE